MGVSDPAPLPEEPTREIWAAMADAYNNAHHECGRQASLHHDRVTGAIYEAIRACLIKGQDV